MIIIFSVIGSYTVNSNPFDLFSLSFFGLLAYVLIKLECEPAPLLLGFVLGPMFEEQLRRAMIISRGDPSIFVTRPISAGLIACTVLMLVLAALPAFAKKRNEVFVDD
jgi:TctA family transporter